MRRPKMLHYCLLLCVLETLCATYFLRWTPGAAPCSWVYCGAGIALSVCLLFTFPPNHRHPPGGVSHRTGLAIKAVLILSAGLLIFYGSSILLRENPIDYHKADMLPVIRAMNERFLRGNWKQVYDNIPGIWNGSKPIYLPFMWLPFSPAVAAGVDPRWITTAALYLSIALLIGAMPFSKKPLGCSMLVMSLGLLLAWFFTDDDQHGFVSLTEEPLIVLYYVLLAFSLRSGKILLVALAASVCMLSRYAGIGFVLALTIFLLLSGKKKPAMWFAAVVLMAIPVFFILPFGWQPFSEMLRLPARYIPFSARVWQSTPEVFTGELGFARFFVPAKIALLHHLLLWFTFVIPALVAGAAYLFRRKINSGNVPLALLKLSLVIFYNFIDVPYLYLFYTSSFVSLAAVLHCLREPPKKELVSAALPAS